MRIREERSDNPYRPILCEIAFEGTPKEFKEILSGISLADNITSDLALQLYKALRRASED